MTNLSPAAQAVLDAVMRYEINPECYSREIAAAALRAVADQVVPVLTTAEGARINDSIEAIAAELEAQQ
jgi:predicted oxidoreductase